jgi:hypothetical protein
MKILAQQPGWDGLSWQWNPADGDSQDQLHVEDKHADALFAGKTLSSFESEQLQKQFLEALRRKTTWYRSSKYCHNGMKKFMQAKK